MLHLCCCVSLCSHLPLCVVSVGLDGDSSGGFLPLLSCASSPCYYRCWTVIRKECIRGRGKAEEERRNSWDVPSHCCAAVFICAKCG